MKNLIEKFNHEKNFVIITPYPPKKSIYNGKGGLYSFGKNFAKYLVKKIKNKIIVLSQINKRAECYLENNKIIVLKVFKKNNLYSFLTNLFFYLYKLKNVKKFIIQFEFNSFGGPQITLGILLYALILHFLKKEIYLILHQVELDLNNLYGHLGWKKNSFKSKIYSFLIKKYYFLICQLSTKVFVLEKIFKRRLAELKINEEKITVIPHGVDNKFKIKKNKKASSLLYFGFLSWYKGVDWLVKNINKESKLIIAGGPSPNLNHKSHYKLFLKNLLEKIKSRKNIILTGFVKENKIKNYFNKSEIVIFPYRRMFSSSGPLSLTFSFEKPFILSRPLEGYFESPDFQEALKETGLKKEDFLFDFTPESFETRLNWARKNLDKLSHFSKIMKQKRSWEKVAERYVGILGS